MRVKTVALKRKKDCALRIKRKAESESKLMINIAEAPHASLPREIQNYLNIKEKEVFWSPKHSIMKPLSPATVDGVAWL